MRAEFAQQIITKPRTTSTPMAHFSDMSSARQGPPLPCPRSTGAELFTSPAVQKSVVYTNLNASKMTYWLPLSSFDTLSCCAPLSRLNFPNEFHCAPFTRWLTTRRTSVLLEVRMVIGTRLESHPEQPGLPGCHSKISQHPHEVRIGA